MGIPLKKPKIPLAQVTYSIYKNRNTLKCLPGAIPDDLMSYIRQAFGGSASDRIIVERSDLPIRCDLKDSMLVEKGLDVQDI